MYLDVTVGVDVHVEIDVDVGASMHVLTPFAVGARAASVILLSKYLSIMLGMLCLLFFMSHIILHVHEGGCARACRDRCGCGCVYACTHVGARAVSVILLLKYLSIMLGMLFFMSHIMLHVHVEWCVPG